jgi:hypothetical protein
LRFQLYVLKHDNWRDYSERKHLGFTVINSEKAKDYPLNFVCILPLKLGSNENKTTTFERLFGDKSSETAKELLTDALKSEEDEDVRSEIERRLKLLDPESAREKTCASCGKTFHSDQRKRFKQRFCQDCLKKKFGDRN